jgi:hypothetical protein
MLAKSELGDCDGCNSQRLVSVYVRNDHPRKRSVIPRASRLLDIRTEIQTYKVCIQLACVTLTDVIPSQTFPSNLSPLQAASNLR